jgi:glutathione S-transferase
MPKPRLVTIGPSHYCEKARWALERAGIEYVEHAHAPVLHYGATLLLHLQRTTPILVTPHGSIKDSTAILRHADKFVPDDRRLFPSDPEACAEVEALEEMFDRSLGPATRRVAYFHVLSDVPKLRQLVEPRIPRAEQMLFRMGRPGIVAFLRWGLKIEPEAAKRSEARVESVFGEVESRLARGARRYLVGDRLTAADLTFAALAAPVVLPPEYGWPLPSIEDGPSDLLRLRDRLRSRPAGTFALRLYKEERHLSAMQMAAGA